MKSAELKVLSAELKDRPQFAWYQPSPNYKIPPTIRVAFTECKSAEYSFYYSALSTQH
ncbi:MAG: hypothetical protein KME59_14365 [Trichormus sp. ATA11-4-KO1]|jgi:hypothetical protein|nr:hypothetical protein [Trichormus sp. ATA11-4-KO1]